MDNIDRFSIVLVKDERTALTKPSDTGEWVSYEDYKTKLDQTNTTIDKLCEKLEDAANKMTSHELRDKYLNFLKEVRGE